MELLIGDRLGKYEILGRLAVGGMAEVYLAKIVGHAGFTKPVALKRMLPQLANEAGFREMFMQEAAVAARLNHPHVVQIFDFAEEDGELYLAMEFVHGVNLRKLHADARNHGQSDLLMKMRPMLAAHVARCVARALGYAWSVADEDGEPLHLIHRDVSPHNILLSYQGDVKLADFGIAKPAGMHTTVGTVKGKLLYMAPEQLRGGTLDCRTDIFALGIVLYETALGMQQPLFDAGHELGARLAVQERRIVPPVRMDPDFPAGLSAVIMKALDRDPEKRFQTAVELADALGEALHHEAKSPLEYDLAGFMRLLYGEAPAIRGLFSQSPRSAGPKTIEQLDQIARNGDAATIRREHAEELRAAGDGTDPAVAPIPLEAEGRSGIRDVGPPVNAEASTRSDAPDGYSAAEQEEKAPPSGKPPARTLWLAALGGAAAAAVALSIGVVVQKRRVASTSSSTELVQQSVPPVDPPRPPVADPVASPVEPVAAPPHEPAVARPEPAVAQPGPAVAQPGPVVASEIAPEPARPPEPIRRGTGTLDVQVKGRPWVAVWVDGEEHSEGRADQEAAPRLERKLPAGRHVVHVRDETALVRHAEIVLHPGRRVVLQAHVVDGALTVDVR